MTIEALITNLTRDEWIDVDNWAWDALTEVAPRFVFSFLDRKHSTSDFEEVVHDFIVIAFPRIKSLVERNPDIKKTRRTEIFFGTLKAIKGTAFKARIPLILPIKNVNSHTNNNDGIKADHVYSEYCFDNDNPIGETTMFSPEKHGNLLALANLSFPHEPDNEFDVVSDKEDHELRLLRYLESVRPTLTPAHHSILYKRVFNCLSVNEIAKSMNRSNSSITKSLALIRQRLKSDYMANETAEPELV